MAKIHHHVNTGSSIEIPCDPLKLRKTAYKINTLDGLFDCKKCKKALEDKLSQAVIVEYKQVLKQKLKLYREKL